MIDFLIMLWLIIALIVEIPKLIQEFKNLKRIRKGDIREEDVEDFIRRIKNNDRKGNTRDIR